MKLLLAEDERELSNAIVRVLKHNNYTVDAVYDGAEALEYLTFGNYDGVILDIMMPKADGLTVLRKVRSPCFCLPRAARSTTESKGLTRARTITLRSRLR